MRNNTTSKSIRTAVIETLESRELLSGTPLTISQTAVYGGTQLQIIGTNGNDSITVKQTAAGLVIGNTGGWTTTVAGAFNSILIKSDNGNDSVAVDASVKTSTTIEGGIGNDTFSDGSGNDTIYAGTGTNTITAGSGTDTIVTLGSTADKVYGGLGNDTFWMDNNASEQVFNVRSNELAYGAVHRISSLYGTSTTTPTTKTVKAAAKGHNFKKHAKKSNTTAVIAANTIASLPLAPEPTVSTSGTTYRNFANQPLFAASGPTADDIRQGYVGDCYYLSALAAVAKVDPMRIESSVVQLADGTYIAQIAEGGQTDFVHVDGALPTWSNGAPVYANFGQGGSMWVAIMEKAFADVRTGANSYASLNSGWMTESFSTFGLNSTGFYSFSNSAQLVSTIQSQLAGNKAVTIGINAPKLGAPLIGSHAYTVVGTVADPSGAGTDVVLRNPWGIAGVTNTSNPNSPYVTVTAAQLFASEMGVVSAAA
jgi:hypothetical protein